MTDSVKRGQRRTVEAADLSCAGKRTATLTGGAVQLGVAFFAHTYALDVMPRTSDIASINVFQAVKAWHLGATPRPH